jgi:hypothetical protein
MCVCDCVTVCLSVCLCLSACVCVIRVCVIRGVFPAAQRRPGSLSPCSLSPRALPLPLPLSLNRIRLSLSLLALSCYLLSFFFPCLFSPRPSSFLSLSFLSLSNSSFLLFSVFTFPSSLARLLSLSPRESSDKDVLDSSM